jgi:hypothetical protein
MLRRPVGILSRVIGGARAEHARRPTPPAVTADRFKLSVSLGREETIGQSAIDVGCVVVLVVAVLIQGLAVALDLPHRVELLADLAAVVLLVWISIGLARGGSRISVPYLALALGVVLMVAAFRSDDFTRLLVSARNFVLPPLLALALASLGERECRNRAVMLTVVGLAVVEFAITIVQAITIDNVDLIGGTFGDYSQQSVAFAIITGACLALGIYAARVKGAPWLVLAMVLPGFLIWAVIRSALPIAPVAGLAVVVGAWWVRKSDRPLGRPWGRPAVTAAAVILSAVAITAGFAVARPRDFALFTNSSERSAYLHDATIYSRAGQWTSVNGRITRARGEPLGGRASFSVTPFGGVPYAGARADGVSPIQAGGTYSFLASVRASSTGHYQLWAGTYLGTEHRGAVTKVAADQWTPMRVRGVKITATGPLFVALWKPSGSYSRDESISFACITVTKGAIARETQSKGSPRCSSEQTDPSTSSSGNGGDRQSPAKGGGGRKSPAKGDGGRESTAHAGSSASSIPGRLDQYKTAARLIDGGPASFLFGNGLGATTYADNLGVGPPSKAERSAGYSDVGTLIVELGWLGVALAVASAVVLGIGSLVAARRAEPASWTQALLIGYPGVLVTMVALAFFGAPFRNVGSATIFWLLTGLALASILGRRDSPHLSKV